MQDERGLTEDGRKIYTLGDVYPHADLVTYPSSIEGFGNAFLEAVYYRRPILVNNYSIYEVDIKPKGFRAVWFDGFISTETLKQVRQTFAGPCNGAGMGGGKLSACKTIFFLHSSGAPLAIHSRRLSGTANMKIAILHYSVPPIVGGVESVIAHHAQLMSADGHSVRLIAARGESLPTGGRASEEIPLFPIPLADSQHPRVLAVKEQLDRGDVTADFESLRDELTSQLQTALSDVDILIAHNVCSLNKNLALTAALHQLHTSASQNFHA